MRILGIDHGTRTGWSLAVDGIVVKTGSFQMKNPTKNTGKAFMDFLQFVDTLLDETKPDLVRLEKPAHMRNANILRYLVGLHSMAELACCKHNIPVKDIIPSQYKKQIAGDGRADKDGVLYALLKKGIPKEFIYKPVFYKTDKQKIKELKYDESDATALALFKEE